LIDLPLADDPSTIRRIIAAVALAKGDLKLGALINNSDESEINEMLEQYDSWSKVYF